MPKYEKLTPSSTPVLNFRRIALFSFFPKKPVLSEPLDDYVRQKSIDELIAIWVSTSWAGLFEVVLFFRPFMRHE